MTGAPPVTKPAALIATRPTIFAVLDDGVRLVISYPSPEWMRGLTPHAEGDWRNKAAPTKWLRREVASVCSQPGVPKFDRASVTYRFFWPRNGTGDEANMIQRMKPAIDGMKDAGVIVDDNWSRLSTKAVESVKDAENPRIEILVERSIA